MATSRDLPPVGNFVSQFFKPQFCTKIPLPPQGSILRGKVAIITGANSGLGFESAKQFLGAGLSHLVVAVRSLDKGQAAASKLRHVSPEATIDAWALDMESYASVQAFAQKCQTELSQIDIVILNAGISPLKFETTASTGHQTAIQVNYLSTMLLTLLILPILKGKRSPGLPARLCIVNSLMSSLAKFPNRDKRPLLSSFDNPAITPFEPVESYSVSKLLGQLFLARLFSHVKPDEVILNMVEPGYTKGTLLDNGLTGAVSAIVKVMKGITGRPLDQGAATYFDAAVLQGKESHGCFIMNCEIEP